MPDSIGAAVRARNPLPVRWIGRRMGHASGDPPRLGGDGVNDLTRCAGRNGINGRPVACCITCDRRSYAPSTPQTSWIEQQATNTGGVWACPNRLVVIENVPLER